MLSKLTKELLIIVLMFAFFGLLSCVEEPTISPVKRPFSMIRVGNLTINKANLHVQIQDIDENVIQDLNIAKNTVNIPNHFFVTGEKVNYSFQGATTLNAVSIEETVVAGIGTTDKLPQELFVVKFGLELILKLKAKNQTEPIK